MRSAHSQVPMYLFLLAVHTLRQSYEQITQKN